MRRSASLLAIAIFLVVSESAEAAKIGQAVAVIQEANASGSAGDRVLEVGGPLFVGDLLESGPVGQAQLVFVDDTKMVLGPNSSLAIDTYVLRNEASFENLSINTLRGTYRFLSGNSPHDAYAINTASATIGVRGTALDISSRDDGTGVLGYKGLVRVCNKVPEKKEKDCKFVRPGDLVDVNSDGKVRLIDDPEEKIQYILKYFPYAFDQSTLLADFRLDNGVIFGNVLDQDINIEPTSGSPN